MDGWDFLNALPLVTAVVDAFRSACGLQRTIGISGPRRPPRFSVVTIIPVGGIFTMAFPAAFAVGDAVALAVEVVNLPALGSPFLCLFTLSPMYLLPPTKYTHGRVSKLQL